MFLKMEMDDRGIPILELDVEYGDGQSGQLTTRCEAFLEMLRNSMEKPVVYSKKSRGSRSAHVTR
jgi:hypothetical protein